MKNIVITGSLAYDHIMSFPDHFKNHILPDKIPVLSVSFMVDGFQRHFGGTAGNIAYTARLLGMHSTILSTGGNDFDAYARWLTDNTIATDAIRVFDDIATAQAFIITDRDNSQITAFHPGSMNRAGECSLHDLPEQPDLVIISANGIDGMRSLVQECKEGKIPYIYDPGQAMPALSVTDLKDGVMHASILTVNEYEMSMITQKTELSLEQVCEFVPTVIVTRGAHGSTIHTHDTAVQIPIAYAEQLRDPTGCGDAHRAGLLFGLTHGLSWEVTGRIAALAATYNAECHGTQNHSFTWDEFKARYASAFAQELRI